jgi:hypothetical protein
LKALGDQKVVAKQNQIYSMNEVIIAKKRESNAVESKIIDNEAMHLLVLRQIGQNLDMNQQFKQARINQEQARFKNDDAVIKE